MPFFKLITAFFISILVVTAHAQSETGGMPQQPDQVQQLTELLDLDSDQQSEMRAVMNEGEAKINGMEEEFVALQQRLREQVGPNFDEASIRADAAELGKLTGDMTAESLIMQAKIDSIFTEDQRNKLEEVIQQQQAQQQQMQQLQRQMQQQQYQ